MLFFIIACQPNKTAEIDTTTIISETTTDLEISPSAYTYDKDTTSQEEFDLTSISADISAVFTNLRQFHATPLLQLYYQAMDTSDSTCPTNYAQDGNAFWYAQCTSDSGTNFDGYTFYNEYEDYDLFGDGNSWDAQVLNGSADIRLQQETIHWGGNAYVGTGLNTNQQDIYVSFINGSFYHSSSNASWLANGNSMLLMLYALKDATVAANGLYFDGSIPVFDSYITAIRFHQNSVYHANFYYPCPAEPINPLSIRTPEGNWIDIEFDVSDQWQLTGDCDGCGIAFHKDEELGEVCIDTSGLLAWEEQPW